MERLDETMGDCPGPILLDSEEVGRRIDRVLSARLPRFSRAQIQRWMSQGGLELDGEVCLDKSLRLSSQHRRLDFRAPLKQELQSWSGEEGNLRVRFEDETLLVIDKAADLVVHPGAGHREGTLVNHLIHYHPPLAALPRAGLVHRLDKGTTGLLVVAKTLEAQTQLIRQMQSRLIHREYRCFVRGAPPPAGKVDKPMGRDPRCRTRMAVLSSNGRPALTFFQTLRRFQNCAYLKVCLATGRTHQIRVHLSHLGFPLLGDKTYGGPALWPIAGPELFLWERPALHACCLRFQHPFSKDLALEIEAPLPPDFKAALPGLNGEGGSHFEGA